MGDITTGFVQQFGTTVDHLAQQRGTRLRKTIRRQTQVKGEYAYFEQLASTSAVRNLPRNSDSPLIKSDQRRRRADMQNIEWGDLIDDFDKVRSLIDPTSPISMSAGFAVGREIDLIILEEVFGTADTGKSGGTPVTFPAGQVVAVDFGGANSGLTVGKLREARRLLLAGNVDPEADGPFHIVVNASALDDLLQSTEVTSGDFNTVKALVRGEIDTFLGFNFVHSELVSNADLLDANGYTRIPAYTSTALALAIGMEPKARIQERSDKRFSTYVYWASAAGATRLEEAKVVEIKIDESA